MSGLAEPVAHPLGAARLGRKQVRDHPLHRRVLLGQHVRRTLVAGRARGRRELLVDRAADDRVHEPKLAAVGEDAAGPERVGGLAGVLVLEPSERRRMPQQPAVAHDCHCTREPLSWQRKAGQPRADRRDNPVGRRVEHIARALRPGLAQSARKLAQEERVPARQQMTTAAQRRERAGNGGTHELRRRAVTQPLRAQQRGSATSDQHVRDRGAARLAGRPRSDHQKHRDPAQPITQIREEAQRRAVGPMRIVDQ